MRLPEQIVAEEPADLVPRACGSRRHGRRTATARRSASGSFAITTSAETRRASPMARSSAPGSSGFGKATVGKSGSGANCGRPTPAGRSPRRRGGPAGRRRRRRAAACRRSRSPRGPSGSRRRGRRGRVGTKDRFLVEVLDQPLLTGRRLGERRRPELAGERGDPRVVGRDDLRTVSGIGLVAVVGRRVVARGDHHPRGGPEVADGERGERGGERSWQQTDAHTRPGCDGGRVGGEDRRSVAGVAADDDARFAASSPLSATQRATPAVVAAHDGTVHPRRASAERAAQPGGAEDERPVEPGAQFAPRHPRPAVPRARDGSPGLGLGRSRPRNLGDEGGGKRRPASATSVRGRHNRPTNPAISRARAGAAAAPASSTSTWSIGAWVTPAAWFVTSETPSTAAPR